MSEAKPQRPLYDDLAALVATQATRISELEACNAQLVNELADLRRRLGMGSANSSRPPSQDGLAKAKWSSGSSGDLCGLSVSADTLVAAIGGVAVRLDPVVDRMRTLLRAAPVLGADKTRPGSSAAGSDVHLTCTSMLALLQAGDRSKAWSPNNQSERRLRLAKPQQKVSGTWRSIQGLADFATVPLLPVHRNQPGMDCWQSSISCSRSAPWLPPDPVAVSSRTRTITRE